MTSIGYLNIIYKAGKSFFTTSELGVLLGVSSVRTLEDLIKRLIVEKILIQLERGKYMLASKTPSDFDVAQFLYAPSYISLETALNYHGILSQFPTEITSVTTKKRLSKNILGKIYSYSKLKTELFTGYYKEEGFLIACPEKALFDQLYMISKSLKSAEYLNEMDYSGIDVAKVNSYVDLVSDNYAIKLKGLIKNFI